MRAHGVCLMCHRVKRINIHPSQALSRVPCGECDDCIQARRRSLRARNQANQPRKDTK